MRDPLPHVSTLDLARRLAAAAAVALLVLLPTAALGQAADATWTQFQGDAAHAGVAASGPEPPYQEAWTFPIEPKDGEGASAPVVTGGLAVTAGPEAVYGIDLASGEQRWTVTRDGPPAPVAIATGGDRTLVLFTDGRDAESAKLRAIDLDTQKDAWDVPLTLGAVSRTGVTVDGDQAFVADGDGTVYAVDVATGAESWTSELAGEPKGPMPVADGKVFAIPLDPDFGSLAASLVALDEATGETAWTVDLTPPASFASLPAAAGGSVVVVSPAAPSGGQIRAFSTEDGSLAWDARLNAYVSPWSAPAATAEAVYAIDFIGAGLHAIDTGTGEHVWQFEFNDHVLRGSPAVLPGHVLVGLSDGSLGAVDRTTGHLVWRSTPKLGLIGAMAVTPDLVLAVRGAKDGGIVAFRHDPDGTLADVVSPTIPRYAVIVGTWALAFVVVGAVILVPFVVATRRVGQPTLVRADDAADDEDEDEYDDDDEAYDEDEDGDDE
ncbi:MAG TPA: PQQ-binding-like beta-propeller repeat protein [Actinomycetota bacterium]